MSAAVASGKPALSAPKAEYSIVLSSETRKAATLAIQNTGQDEGAGGCARAGWAAGWRGSWGFLQREGDVFRRPAAGSRAAGP
jgi:hypothetical protein